jgi:YEATS domain-containing protein 1/3
LKFFLRSIYRHTILPICPCYTFPFQLSLSAVKEPPYQLAESGYAGFLLPIEIYFRNKDEPKKIRFQYDMFLHTEGCPPVNNVRCEKLTFQNPTEDFRKKLLKAGAVSI